MKQYSEMDASTQFALERKAQQMRSEYLRALMASLALRFTKLLYVRGGAARNTA